MQHFNCSFERPRAFSSGRPPPQETSRLRRDKQSLCVFAPMAPLATRTGELVLLAAHAYIPDLRALRRDSLDFGIKARPPNKAPC